MHVRTMADFQLNLSYEMWEPVFDGNDINRILASFFLALWRLMIYIYICRTAQS